MLQTRKHGQVSAPLKSQWGRHHCLCVPGSPCLLLEMLLGGVAPPLAPTLQLPHPGSFWAGPLWGDAASCCSAEPPVAVLSAASQPVPGLSCMTQWRVLMGNPRVGQPWLLSWPLPTPLGSSVWERSCPRSDLGSLGILPGSPTSSGPRTLPAFSGFLSYPPMLWGLTAACTLTPAGLCTGSSPRQEHPFSHFHWADAGHAPGPAQMLSPPGPSPGLI